MNKYLLFISMSILRHFIIKYRKKLLEIMKLFPLLSNRPILDTRNFSFGSSKNITESIASDQNLTLNLTI